MGGCKSDLIYTYYYSCFIKWKWNRNVFNCFKLLSFTGCLFPDPKRAAQLGPVIMLPIQLFGGQLVNL